jgi:hypothetical protein
VKELHVPSLSTDKIEIMSFEQTLQEEKTITHDYDTDKWIYLPCRYSEYRYILGTKGVNPLVCIGINPSTAAPDDLDNTLKSVERIAHFNGYDSFIMFNVYPQRATNPDDMDKELNSYLHSENIKAFRYILSLYKDGHTPSIWAAWGTLIEKRPYLKQCVLDFIKCGQEFGARWYTSGARSKLKGHPHHPLYLKKDSKTDLFLDIVEYLQGI